MKVYVATKFEDAAVARSVMQRVVGIGHSITYDWTTEKTPDNPTEVTLGGCAVHDTWGVLTADVLLLIPTPDIKGAWVEMGIAIGASWFGGDQIRVIVVGEPLCVFCYLPQVTRVKDIDAAIELLASWGDVAS